MKEDLFEIMVRLTERIKGAPLREAEKKELREKFDAASGSAFERSRAAVASVLHSKLKILDEKSEARSDVNQLLSELKRKAEDLESSIK